MNLDLSIVIITLNEEENIGACIRSLPAGAEVIVLDSHSSDQTLAVAKSLGARTSTRAFTNYAEQKNAAIDLATRSWVLSVDADERSCDQLNQTLSQIVQSASDVAGYRIKRRLVFDGKALRFGKSTDWPIRLFRKDSAKFQNAIHEELSFSSQEAIGRLKEGELLHYSYKNLTDYFDRFNRYTSGVAAQHKARGKQRNIVAVCLRPWAEFFSRYILRLGFLDGYQGYTYALISSLYVFVKLAKQIEK
jgi:glycosyltransferase involved in cell wall biosynthesis